MSAQAQLPLFGASTRDDHGHDEWASQSEPTFCGETLDKKSRAVIRRLLSKKMRSEPWCDWWVGVSNVPRRPLVYECAKAIRTYWSGQPDKGEGVACWTFQAIAEEIDLYLPKAFWKEKRHKRYSASKVFVDPDWPTFQKWHFEFPETRERLLKERDFLNYAQELHERKKNDVEHDTTDVSQ